MNKEAESNLNHECFPQPENKEIQVWRYMDISKFIWMISNNKLYFPRVDLLGDRHEGAITKASHDIRNHELKQCNVEDMIPTLQEHNRHSRRTLFVNCWRMDESESEAMWKLYCPNNEGVAIQTKYNNLVTLLNADKDLFVGCVKYLNYENEYFPSHNFLYPVMHKRKSFEHEKEIRLVKWLPEYFNINNDNIPPEGIILDWQTEEYIENIYINPYAQKWYYDVVCKIIIALAPKLASKISWSSIKSEPLY